MMLKDIAQINKDTISKNPIVFKVFLEKIIEFFSYYRVFNLKTMFLLILLPNYCSKKKQNSKKNFI